ncbi:MAG TPA: GGDEF domain-containing protein [Candidatus Acidoferrales bacterium]|jgi:diguanylate cyclase (GGDEF)-like protein|nr:GGDEF domain-containing protein [Candidatus Acidoferrales bacterium]
MALLQRLKVLRPVGRPWWLAVVACTGAVAVGHFLRQLNIVLNPLAWSSAEIISALLSFTIAASVLVRYHGTGNRISLLLGLTFGVTGIIHLGAIFEFYDHFLKPSEQVRVPVSWMIGQTLLGLLLLVACVINKWLPWPRDPGKTFVALTSIVVSATCLVAATFLIFPSTPPIRPHSPTPRVWELLPAAVFLIAAVALNGVKESDGFAFDTALVWVAGLNVMSHLIASQSARLLDASAGVAELVNAISYIVLLGATLLDNARLFRQVRTLAISDSLTGLANYRHLVDVLQGELERSGRTDRPFSVLLMDLDGLKKINDHHGHVIGSRALCRVATILRLNSRSIDTAARYGGDEFALVLPETNVSAAEQVVERVRNCLMADEEVPSLSISIGIATFPKCGTSVQQLLEYADRALYAMKEQSKRGRLEKRKRS